MNARPSVWTQTFVELSQVRLPVVISQQQMARIVNLQRHLPHGSLNTVCITST